MQLWRKPRVKVIQPGTQKVDQQVMVAVPLAVAVECDDQQVVPLELFEHPG